MAQPKLTISTTEDRERAARRAAERQGMTVSAWWNEAADAALRQEALAEALADVLAEEGWSESEVLAEAAAARAAAVATSGRPS